MAGTHCGRGELGWAGWGTLRADGERGAWHGPSSPGLLRPGTRPPTPATRPSRRSIGLSITRPHSRAAERKASPLNNPSAHEEVTVEMVKPQKQTLLEKRPSGPVGCGRVGLGGGAGSGCSPGTEAPGAQPPAAKRKKHHRTHTAHHRGQRPVTWWRGGVRRGGPPARSFPEEANNTSSLASQVTRSKSSETLGGKKGQDWVLPRARG